ncbi:MAG: V-type ATP synthase subunit E [Candidatus Omnitrophota bacterium]
MAVEKLLSKIQEDVQKETEELLSQTDREIQELEKQFQEKSVQRAQDLIARGELKLRQTAERELTAERLSSRRNILAEKQKILEEIYQTVLAQIKKDPEKLRGFFSTNLELLAPGKYHLKIAKDLSAVLSSEWVTSTTERLQKTGRKVESVTYQDDLSGEIVLTSGKIELALSPEKILSLKRPETEKELAKLLFRENNTTE